MIAEGRTRNMKKQLKQLTVPGSAAEAPQGQLNLTFDITLDSITQKATAAAGSADSGPSSSRKVGTSDDSVPLLKTANISVSTTKPPE